MTLASKRGFASIAALGVLAILGVLALRIYLSSGRITKNLSDEIKTRIARESERINSGKQLKSSRLPGGIGVFGNGSGSFLVRTNVNQPLLDFNRLLEDAAVCENFSVNYPLETPLGFQLSKRSSVSNYTCIVKNNVLSGAYLGNVTISDLLTDSSKSNGLVVVATGYAEIDNLYVQSDVVIMTGGDLHIGRIQKIGEIPTRTTLVSATGLVLVEASEGAISAYVYGREGTRLPSGMTVYEGTGDVPTYTAEILALSVAP